MQQTDTSCLAVTVGEQCSTDMAQLLEYMSGCSLLPLNHLDKFNDIDKIKEVCLDRFG